MVCLDDLGHRGARDLLGNPGTMGGVMTHDGDFLGREGADLVANLRGDQMLAQVVDQGCMHEAVEILGSQTQRLADGPRKGGDVDWVRGLVMAEDARAFEDLVASGAQSRPDRRQPARLVGGRPARGDPGSRGRQE